MKVLQKAVSSSFKIVILMLLFIATSESKSALKPCPKRNSGNIDLTGVFHWQIDPLVELQKTERKHVKMSCNGVGFYPFNSIAPDVTMVWTHNGNIIHSSKRVSISGKSKDRNTCVSGVNLKISNLKVKDSGSYSCKVIRQDTGETVLHENFSLLVKKQGN